MWIDENRGNWTAAKLRLFVVWHQTPETDASPHPGRETSLRGHLATIRVPIRRGPEGHFLQTFARSFLT